MIAFLLLMFAHRADAADPRLAGIPTAALAPLGLGTPDFTIGDDTWRAPAPGGWVLHTWSADETEGQRRFAFEVGAAQRMFPPVSVAGADEARGDLGLVIARRGNVVLTVRGDDAPALAARLLAAEVVERATVWVGPVGPPETSAEAVRDEFGRRLGG
ncbi:hypothetical protein LBMAG42_41030 [Deltaproteobacteria bacterium]|nr:hypothetical protein LBMAG42_41030 [Deltaproteobacteria bacterium]